MHIYCVLCCILLIFFEPVYLESGTGAEEWENDVDIQSKQWEFEENIGRVPVADDAENLNDENEQQTPTEPNENNVVIDNREIIEDNGERRSFPEDDLTLIKKENDFYSFTVNDIKGDPIKLEKYRGKVSLVVNVASECGFTEAHYTSLVKLQDMLQSSAMFNILAFPCNQFGAQEPGENSEIEKYVKEKFQVNFPLFTKIRVLDSDVPPAWQYLIEKSGKVPNWNFWKYLVNENGEVVDAWGPWTSVEELHSQIKVLVDNLTRPIDPALPHLNVEGHDAGEL